MKRRQMMLVCLTFSLVASHLVASAASSGDWPTRWQVNANGATGMLEFSIREDGSLIGRLLDEYVEGYVAGRRLFVRRTAEDRTEVWEGWLGTGSNLIVAGTISVDEAGETLVYPWFGTPDGSARSSLLPSPSTAAPPAVVSASPAPSPPPDGSLTGTWATSSGEQVTIVQAGNSLTVTRSDGSSHDGRMTGSSTLVVGLKKGCCNGKLDDPNSITWSDGARWRRAN